MYLETAIEAARLGAGILLEHIDSEEKSHVSQKQQFDFVTEVDHLAEKSLIEFIHKRHPKHDILAEESGRQFSDSEFQWIIERSSRAPSATPAATRSSMRIRAVAPF